MACYRASTRENYDGNGVLRSVYPPPPTYNAGCPSNIDYDTLPANFPMRKTILGPNSLKHLYKGPRYYPPQKMMIPDGSMYQADFSKRNPDGTIISYGAKMYPYQHRHPREISETVPTFIPAPNQFEWTRYTTVSDGAWSL